MKFALVTEGVSEHRVMKHLIAKYFKEQEPDINQIQPKLLNNKQETIGGWNEVLKYCEREDIRDILIENDYLVIQIDTDQCPTIPFSINHSKDGGKAKTPEELHTDVVAKLNSLINPEILEQYSDKIFFAVCIHTIECWLLPLVYTNNKKSATTDCLTKLNAELSKKDKPTIPATAKNGANGMAAYREVLSALKKKADIEAIAKHNVGFLQFIAHLSTVSSGQEIF